jgi:opacity protein-like surface antigen
MRKLALLLAVLAVSLTASAQFEEGKKYVGLSATGLDFNYSGKNDFKIGMEARGGYFLFDNLMATGSLKYDNNGKAPDCFSVGVGGRYYILQNGIYLGANVEFIHADTNYNDLMPGVEVGYAFFLNRYLTIEPALYYQQSFKKHSDYSCVGLKVGFGFYF